MDNRFPVALRLVEASQFKAVFNKPKRSHGRALTVLFQPTSVGFARLGTAIAKKKTRTGVERNRIKRVIKESFRLHQHRFESVDLIVLARDGVTQFTNVALFKELSEHWNRVGLSD